MTGVRDRKLEILSYLIVDQDVFECDDLSIHLHTICVRAASMRVHRE